MTEELRCHVCDKELDPSWNKFEGEGRLTWRDPVNGRIQHAHISTEEATRAGAGVSKYGKPEDAEVESVIIEMGYDPENCPPTMKILAQRAASGQAHSIAAVKALRDIRKEGGAEWQEGEECPTCGGHSTTYVVEMEQETKQAMLRALELIDNAQQLERSGYDPVYSLLAEVQKHWEWPEEEPEAAEEEEPEVLM